MAIKLLYCYETLTMLWILKDILMNKHLMNTLIMITYGISTPIIASNLGTDYASSDEFANVIFPTKARADEQAAIPFRERKETREQREKRLLFNRLSAKESRRRNNKWIQEMQAKILALSYQKDVLEIQINMLLAEQEYIKKQQNIHQQYLVPTDTMLP